MRWTHGWPKRENDVCLEGSKNGGLPAVFCSTFDILP